MAGIFKKVASAFVEFPVGQGPASVPSRAEASDLDEITKNASDLMAQLEPSAATPAAAPVDTLPAGATRMGMTADDVFAAAGMQDGPSSSRRLIKMIAGLSAFPPPQQVAMVRALDAADDTWSEAEVLGDARQRQGVLRQHLEGVEAEKAERLRSLQARTQQTQAEGQATLTEIDRQIAELQKMRQEAVSATAGAVAGLEAERQQVEAAAERARAGIQQVITALAGLVTFFAGDSRPS